MVCSERDGALPEFAVGVVHDDLIGEAGAEKRPIQGRARLKQHGADLAFVQDPEYPEERVWAMQTWYSKDFEPVPAQLASPQRVGIFVANNEQIVRRLPHQA